jgi:hypothetical protein
MNVPHRENLIEQTFNSQSIEFVWLFDNQLLICKIFRSPKIYMEGGEVNRDGDFIGKPKVLDVFIVDAAGDGVMRPKPFLTEPTYWTDKVFPEVYKNFRNGTDLIPLVKEVVDDLNEYGEINVH